MQHGLILAGVGIVAALATLAVSADNNHTQPAAPTNVLGYTMKDIDGKDIPLSKYKGKVLLLVNVASRCGNTPQYKPLETLYEKYKDQGLVILGFPANNFGAQEPGTNPEIKQFCTGNYNVTFPMFSKISVKGADIDPLYKFLTDKSTDPQFGGDIEWNFAKFLVARDGTLVNRFPAGMSPDKQNVVDAIEAELKKPEPK